MNRAYIVLIIILNFLELSAAVTGFYFYKKIKNTYWKLFPPFLLLLFLIEITAELFNFGLGLPNVNSALYKYIAIPGQFLFYFWLFYKYFEGKKVRKMPVYYAMIYIATLIFDHFQTIHFNPWFNDFSYTVGNILIILSVFNFISVFIKSDEIIQFKSSMMFWVVIGLLVFFAGSLPYWLIRNYLNNFPAIGNGLMFLQFSLNYMMYMCFIISFRWGQPK